MISICGIFFIYVSTQSKCQSVSVMWDSIAPHIFTRFRYHLHHVIVKYEETVKSESKLLIWRQLVWWRFSYFDIFGMLFGCLKYFSTSKLPGKNNVEHLKKYFRGWVRDFSTHIICFSGAALYDENNENQGSLILTWINTLFRESI